MSVLILMYHRTPQSDVDSSYDVPMRTFERQIRALVETGVKFIPFSQSLDRRYYDREIAVGVTFDDGHKSNLDAFEFLADFGIVPTAFIVSQYCTGGGADYMTPSDLIAAADMCEFGAHGHTHTNLAALAPSELKSELSKSKHILEDILQQPVTTMSAPGGKISGAVTSAARNCGFEVVGSSAEVLNLRPQNPVGRVCIRNGNDPDDLVRLVRRGAWSWRRKNAWFRTKQTARRVLSPFLSHNTNVCALLGGSAALGAEICPLIGG